MTNRASNLQTTDPETPITGTGAAEADEDQAKLDTGGPAERRRPREQRLVGTLVATTCAMVFVTCVTVDLACAEILGRILAQHRQRIQAAAVVQPALSEASLPASS